MPPAKITLRTVVFFLALTSAAAAAEDVPRPVAVICESMRNYTECAALLNCILRPAGIRVEHYKEWLPIGEYRNYAAVVVVPPIWQNARRPQLMAAAQRHATGCENPRSALLKNTHWPLVRLISD